MKPDIEACYWAAKYFLEAGLTSSAREILDEAIQKFDAHPDSKRIKDLRRSIGG
jgi:hypothetical protein